MAQLFIRHLDTSGRPIRSFNWGDRLLKLDFHNELAVITGAASGIGKSTAIAFAHLGAKIALIDVNQESVKQVANQCLQMGAFCKSYHADVADFEATRNIFKQILVHLGEIGILINVAGIWERVPFLNMSGKDLDRMIDINFKGCFNTIKLVLPQMVERRHGKIVSVASVAGKMGSSAGAAHYAASKGALIALTRSLAREFGEFNIHINAVAPGVIETPMVQKIGRAAIKGNQVQQSALKRVGKPEEVAAVIVFLSSSLSSFITGQVWNVCGGYLMD